MNKNSLYDLIAEIENNNKHQSPLIIKWCRHVIEYLVNTPEERNIINFQNFYHSVRMSYTLPPLTKKDIKKVELILGSEFIFIGRWEGIEEFENINFKYAEEISMHKSAYDRRLLLKTKLINGEITRDLYNERLNSHLCQSYNPLEGKRNICPSKIKFTPLRVNLIKLI